MMGLAFRNLWRRKRRTLITATSIGFGVWLAVLILGVWESTSERFVEVGAKGGFGYLTIGDASFRSNQAQLSKMIEIDKILQKLKEIPEVSFAVPRRVGESIIQSTSYNTGAAWIAVDPRLESASVSLYCQYMLEGDCGPGWQKGAIIGANLAEKLRLKRGDSLVYTIQTREGQSISLMTEVHGIFRSGSDELDGHLYLLPIQELHDQLPEDGRFFSYIAIFVDNSSFVEKVKKVVQGELDSSKKVLTWKETQPSMVEVFAANRLLYYLLLTFIGLIIASGITTCMNMNFIERRKEIATMLAIGMRPRQILTLLLEEAVLLGTVGVTLGVLAIAPIYLYLHFIGWDVSPFLGNTMNLGGVTRADAIIHCELMPLQFIVIVTTPIVASLIAAFVPAYFAAHSLPIDILREA